LLQTIEKCFALVLEKSLLSLSRSPSVVSYWVKIAGESKIVLVGSNDILTYLNGNEIQQDAGKAITSWQKYGGKIQKDDHGYYSIPQLEGLNAYSELPCFLTHDEYNDRGNHDHDFGILTGCFELFHHTDLRDKPPGGSMFWDDFIGCIMARITQELSRAEKSESQKEIAFWKGALDRRLVHSDCAGCNFPDSDRIYIAHMK
jgi:hypothetical protein